MTTQELHNLPIVRLEAKTRKGRNVIREWGEQWFVREVTDNVACQNGGTGMLVFPCKPSRSGAPIDRDAANNNRWVAESDDNDFTIKQAWRTFNGTTWAIGSLRSWYAEEGD